MIDFVARGRCTSVVLQRFCDLYHGAVYIYYNSVRFTHMCASELMVNLTKQTFGIWSSSWCGNNIRARCIRLTSDNEGFRTLQTDVVCDLWSWWYLYRIDEFSSNYRAVDICGTTRSALAVVGFYFIKTYLHDTMTFAMHSVAFRHFPS